MSGFRDSFTKDDAKEGLLGYDDAAFLYFAGCILTVIATPWTYYLVKGALFPGASEEETGKPTDRKCKTSTVAARKAKTQKSRIGRSFFIQAGILAVMWLCLAAIILTSQGHQEINQFDPFAILEIPRDASTEDIKKAYRKLSKIYHPDKNRDNPLAVSRFYEIKNAMDALTDETKKLNWEKYGNPDGPQTSKVGIGLPRFLLEKDNQLVILCIFFFFLVFVVPMSAISYYQRAKNYAANGVLIETLHTLASYINDATRVKQCPELLAISGECRSMEFRATDNEAMKPLAAEVVEHKKAQFSQWPVIMKNSFLVWGHMQRLHHLMTPELQQDLDKVLGYSMKITQSMIEIACMREWFFTAQSIIEFRRSLVQGLDLKSNQLIQVPHFTEEIAKTVSKGKNAPSTLAAFIQKTAEERKALCSDLDAEQMLDVEAFSEHVSHMELTATVKVEEENEIVVHDIATVVIELRRNNLKEGETAGLVHAPLFPDAKYEEWWLFLVEGAHSRIISFERVRKTDKLIQEKMRFQLSRPGKHRLELHAICDSYAGLDQKVVLEFNVLQENDPAVKREIIVHKEDEDIDLHPTLFQQFMGDFGHEEESEDEDEEDNSKKKGDADTQAPAPKIEEVEDDNDEDASSESSSDSD
mmetsp:Transcript_57012/g.121142  ORF Transcript_57012/g.121142 Transcript_57012/m.121142 type:complete len:642 (+) Transcript_57012:275-2200(+)